MNGSARYRSRFRPGLEGGSVASRIPGCSVCIRAVAASMDCPGFRRTNTWSHHDVRRSRRDSLPRMSGSTPSGITTSNDRPGASPKNPGGVTPTIVSGTRSSVSVRPIASGAPPKCVCQNAWLITTTGPPLPPPRASSDGWNRRPSAGLTPSTSKAPALAHTPLTNWLSPPVLRSNCASNPVHANAPSNRAPCRWISSQIG